MTIFRERASVLCIDHNRLLALRHTSPEHGDFWGVPGGAIEPGETPLQAALRETREESGYITELVYDPQTVSEYDFSWQGHLYHCRTHWFVVRPIADAPHAPRAGDVEFITELRWLPLSDWPTLFDGHEVLLGAIGELMGERETQSGSFDEPI